MDVSIMVEGQMGLNWPRWRGIVEATERLGFAGLYRSDHFVQPRAPDQDSLELVTSLAYAAATTARITFGALVSPVSFRDPVMLARQAAALGDLSGGRHRFGLGAGWMDREHEMFGYELGDVPTRFARLEEALEVVTRLLRSGEPVTFEGRFYRLLDAAYHPRPSQPVTIVVGGNGPRRTLPLAARYADEWNGNWMNAEAFAQRCARLDELLATHGRKPDEVRRTLMTGVFFGPDVGGLEARLESARANPAFEGKGTAEVVEALRERGALAGTPETIREQLEGLARAGCDEVMVQWLALDDLDGLAKLAAGLLG